MDISEQDLKKAVTLLEKAEVVYLIGQLRSSPVADLMRYILTMLGKRCVLLDPSGGLATHMARAIRKTDVLFAISFRFYATEVVNIVEEAAKRKVPSSRCRTARCLHSRRPRPSCSRCPSTSTRSRGRSRRRCASRRG